MRCEGGKINCLWVVREKETIKEIIHLKAIISQKVFIIYSMKVKPLLRLRFVTSDSGWKVMVRCG